MRQSRKNYKRIVIKVGSSLFYSERARLSLDFLNALAEDISKDRQSQFIIVSSGAIALGVELLGLSCRPKELSLLQAAAAVGQNALMDNYSRCLAKGGLRCAQVLLTWDDFSDRRRYLSAKNTLLTLLGLGCVPVINENDTISTEEIKFGDNDKLSALVATLVNADLLLILSDVDGLLDKNKALIKRVEKVDSQLMALARPTSSRTSVGGMVTKLEAAKIVSDSGIPCVIANGRQKGIVSSVLKEPQAAVSWTFFAGQGRPFAAKERWIAFGSRPKGKIIVDEGARKALRENKSLLSVGVVAAEGGFACGDIVSLLDSQGKEFARCRSSFSCSEIEKVKGRRSEKEIAHCDNIVIL